MGMYLEQEQLRVHGASEGVNAQAQAQAWPRSGVQGLGFRVFKGLDIMV